MTATIDSVWPSAGRITSLVISVLLCACVSSGPSGRASTSREGEKSVGPESWTHMCAERDSIDVRHHEIDLSLTLGSTSSITGHGKLLIRARRSTSVVVLDAHQLRVDSANMGATRLRFQQVDDQLCVELPKALVAGADASLEFVWEVSTRAEVPQFFSDQVWAGYLASAWMPTIQDPAQRATLALRIAAPDALKVAASGRLLTRRKGAAGSLIHSFIQARPSPPFLFAFAVGDFAEAERRVLASDGTDAVMLRALGPRGADLAGVLTLTEAMYRLLAARTGVSMPSADYTQVFVHGDAAQEAAGLSLLAESALDDLRTDPNDDWIFAHELAHQWFGWLVQCADFADFWLNEGFATFFVAVAKEQRLGKPAYEHEVAVWRERSAKVHAEGKDAPLSLSAPNLTQHPPPTETELQSRGVTYFRGALVLHKLRSELGEQAFWDGIRRYVASRAGKSARTEDFRLALEAASGQSLADFFARWVYAPASDL